MYDVTIIGAGVTGCAIARELSRYNLKVCVLEKASDVCEGTSKANSGLVHAGFDCKPGTLKARLNVRGNELIRELSSQLDFAYKNNGAMVLSFGGSLQELYDRGIANGVEGLQVLSADEARQIEPDLGDEVTEALFAPSAGIVCPFEMTLAFAENALANGADIRLNTWVCNIVKSSEGYKISTNNGEFDTRLIINAAGVAADIIHNMVCEDKIRITPRRGEYYLLDKACGTITETTIFQLPTALGKGVMVSPTVHGNLLIGPTAENIEDKEDVSTTVDGLASIKDKAAKSIKNIPFNKAITNFAGLRAVGETGDFIIRYAAEGFIDAAAIESPGLTSAPAIAEYVAELVGESIDLELKSDFIATRKGIVHFAGLSADEQNDLISKDPSYGRVVCRCETVTEGEIRDAISRPLGAATLDGVKRRTRAGMGRCQAGFCSPRVMELLAEYQGIPLEEVKKR